MKKELLTGNEAIALGARNGGLKIASAYPGTPSTEVLETIAKKYKNEIYAEWAPNEKVALETAIGASVAGSRAMAVMKHVGLNVAADPFFTFAYTGGNAGLVVISADDPGMHSSQNEQDNRNYAKAAKVMMLEPSNSQDCYDFAKIAFKLSEEFDTPILIRLTTRVCHSKSIVLYDNAIDDKGMIVYKKNISKFVATPANAIKMRAKIIDREIAEKEFSKKSNLNDIIDNNSKKGIISSGIAYQYAGEVFGGSVSYLKLGITYPLADDLIKDFAKDKDEIFIIEETDPYLEEHIKMLGINCIGKEKLPAFGELNQDIIRKAFNISDRLNVQKDLQKILQGIPPRPPALCAGCPHRAFFHLIRQKKDIIIYGDIGCYTLGSASPLSALDTCFCMGGSISTAHGGAIANRKTGIRTIGVIGDSTFFHTGINSLMDIAYNNSNAITIILDNRITAMTGHQENPGTGKTLMGNLSKEIDISKLAEAFGFSLEQIFEIDPLDLENLDSILDEVLNDKTKPYLLILKSPCILKKMDIGYKEKYGLNFKPLTVNEERCISCKKCISIGCPAIEFLDIAKIDEISCTGCEICKQICPIDAIE
ncbi:MAG: indolepyruvate ferredoxin oxidoreductase subunit alpha [Clostridiales Family XIII bacterium]|jgi:indolepyruvate ferredoxin oxidoreductase alpha subunit|nr:indolepyruvate ferredoxin oxidoreductase subunit alpha [Clostridiales Family XIII bacterium]